MRGAGQMGLFTNKQKRRADNLVNGAQVMAMSAYIPTRNRFPDLAGILDGSEESTSRWDFFYTISAVSTALSLGKQGIPDTDMEQFLKKLTPTLEDYHPLAMKALGDLGAFCPTDIPQPANIGHWLFFNLKGEELSDTELEGAVVIGHSLAASMNNWYETCG